MFCIPGRFSEAPALAMVWVILFYVLYSAAFLAGAGILSLIGIFLVRERHKISADRREKVRFSDIFSLIRENGALRVRMLSNVFSGFVWTLLFAGATYYIKWNFCTDLSTGVVNSELLGTLSMFLGMITILPMVVGTFIAGPLMKLFGHGLYRQHGHWLKLHPGRRYEYGNHGLPDLPLWYGPLGPLRCLR